MKTESGVHRDPAYDPGDHLPVTIIERKPGWHLVNFRELWRTREILYYLAWRDIKVRYKQTVLGIGWAFVQPLLSMIVFAVFLGRMGGMDAGIENYALFVFAGMLPWTYFANSISVAGNSVVANERLITKIYFPRLHVPFSAVGSALFDFVVAHALLAIMLLIYGVMPGWRILLLPFVSLMMTLAAMGVGALLGALIAAQRDFRYILGFMVQLWMFATVAIYRPTEALGATAQYLAPLNPCHGLVENYRQAVLNGPINWYSLLVSSLSALVMCAIGLAYFRRVERTFADII